MLESAEKKCYCTNTPCRCTRAQSISGAWACPDNRLTHNV
nr:MAG TPA: hypothetical protein [Bacteriophage sp.]